MAFDSVVMSAIVAELSEQLTGGRISKIYQPQSDELVLLLYANGRNHRLILSANARFARLHLTGVEKTNPATPPTFCMLMRKYLDGGRILSVRQVGRERICRFRIGVTDELGNPAEYVLVAEVMGKHSNVVLINPHGRIVDAIRRVTEDVNRYRELLPGLLYVGPPPMTKLDPSELTAANLAAGVAGSQSTTEAWQTLLDQVNGLGPLLAKEAVARAGHPINEPIGQLNPEDLVAAAQAVADPTELAPALLFDHQGRLKDFHAISILHWDGKVQAGFETINACADAFFGRKEQEDRISALRGSLGKLIRDAATRARRKVKLQVQSQESAENAESYRIQGELLTAHLWQVHKGDVEAKVTNYYDPEGGEVVIPLDPTLSPAENAQAIYHRYQKARSGLTQIHEQLKLSRDELAYLEQVEATLQEATTLPDLAEVHRELQAEGYITAKRTRAGQSEKSKGKAKTGAKGGTQSGDGAQKVAPPLTVICTDGLEIWVGRNNRQNDTLTTKLAAPHDLWFHTKEIPGSHVILRVPPGQEIPELAIHEAAALAAWHSKGRDSASVPVDYTLRKHVRKPSGAKPGMVIYDHQKTLWVTPDPELIPILKRHVKGDSNGTGAVVDPDRESD